MNTAVDSLRFYDRSHNGLKQHKQWRCSTEGRNYRKHYWFQSWFFRKMQHSFFSNFTQTDTWRQIQLNTCISFLQASTRDCKNCAENCENHSFIDFNLIHGKFIPHGLIRTHKWPVLSVTGFIARSRVQTTLKFWIFQASIRNCKKLPSLMRYHSLFDLWSQFELAP